LRLHHFGGHHATVKAFLGKKQPKHPLFAFEERQKGKRKMDMRERLLPLVP
jgi:hypothetical protein